MVPGSTRNWIAVNAVQQFNLKKQKTEDTDNSAPKEINNSSRNSGCVGRSCRSSTSQTPISVVTPTLTPIAIFTPTRTSAVDYSWISAHGTRQRPARSSWKVDGKSKLYRYNTVVYSGLLYPSTPARWIQKTRLCDRRVLLRAHTRELHMSFRCSGLSTSLYFTPEWHFCC